MTRIYSNKMHCLSLIVLLCLIAACSSGSGASVMLAEADSGRTVELKRGDTLIIALPTSPATGFSWQVITLAEDVLKQQGDPQYKQDNAAMMGGGGISYLHFSSHQLGRDGACSRLPPAMGSRVSTCTHLRAPRCC